MIPDRLRQKIDQADLVSFDIFDTLIVRGVARPIDAFLMVAHEMGIQDAQRFQKDRIAAEFSARVQAKATPGVQEITLEEIYQQLSLQPQWASLDMAQVLQTERRIEIALCLRHHAVGPVYDHALASGKKVVLTSDMYLDEDCIQQILAKNGYTQHHKLYLSSTLRLTKHAGSLFKHLMQDQGIAQPSRVLHIGDNAVSDLQVPTQQGIQTWPVQRAAEALQKSVHHRRFEALDTAPEAAKEPSQTAVQRHLQRGLITQHVQSHPDDFWTTIGYGYFGPILLGFVSWLAEQSQAKGIDKLFFLARDGHIVHRAFSLLADKGVHQVPSHYLYASRRSLIVPSITAINDDVIKFLTSGSSRLTVEDYIKRIGLQAAPYAAQAQAAGFASLQSPVDKATDADKLKRLLVSLQDPIVEHAQAEKQWLLAYLKQSGLLDGQRVGVVDVGWHGTLQEALSKLLAQQQWPGKLSGFYFGTFAPTASRIAQGLDIQSYACHCGEPAYNQQTIKASVEIFEWFFSAPHGSVLSFQPGADGTIQPVLESNDFEAYRIETATRAQQAALDYIADHVTCTGAAAGSKLTQLPAASSLSMLRQLLSQPTAQEASMLGDIPHVEGFGNTLHVRHIAKPSGSLFNPGYWQRLRPEYGASHWKAGFKARVFGHLSRFL
jgi:predicted HAD superfamily hydrolase